MNAIRAKRIITPDEIITDAALITTDNGKIQSIERDQEAIELLECRDFGDATITPGLIDIHIHGSQRADTMTATLDTFRTMSLFLAAHGVSGFLATTIAANKDAVDQVIDYTLNHKDKLPGARFLGIHLEGPYLVDAHKGAQPSDEIRLPQPEEYHKWFDSGVVKLMTVAPEVKEAHELISYGVQKGVQFAVGHSGASYEQVVQSADWGLNQATHTFNGMLGLHHREPGTVGGVLTDKRIFAQIIVDGIHLHPAIVKLIVTAKGIDRTILITDAIEATGLADGKYHLGKLDVEVKSGIARIPSGSLAGSTLTLDRAIRNVVEFADIPFKDAICMATRTPAAAMQWQAVRGTITPGLDADLTVFGPNHEIIATLVQGKIVYEK